MVNYVKDIYAPFTDEEISAKMVELLTPKGNQGESGNRLSTVGGDCTRLVRIIKATGILAVTLPPTPGGVKMVNRAFIDYIEFRLINSITIQRMRNVTLIMTTGSRFSGKSFGYEKPVAGEVVFNTAMTGYLSLTDPSYAGQLMTLTYPLW